MSEKGLVNHEGEVDRINEIRELFEQWIKLKFNYEECPIRYMDSEIDDTKPAYLEHGLNIVEIEQRISCRTNYFGSYAFRIYVKQQHGDQLGFKLGSLLSQEVTFKNIFDDGSLNTQGGQLINGGLQNGRYLVIMNLNFRYL